MQELIELLDDVEATERLQDEFDIYSQECQCALRIVNARLSNLKETGTVGGHRPTFVSTSRLKTWDSTLEKCDRRGYPLTISSIRENVQDIAGIRIVTVFRDEIFEIVKLINLMPGITVVDEKDYVTHPKPNGYSSYHIGILVENFCGGEIRKTPVEIQIRSKAMDLWATIEHVVKYKNANPSPEAEDIFVALKKFVDTIDEHAIKLRDFTDDENLSADSDTDTSDDPDDPDDALVESNTSGDDSDDSVPDTTE